MSPTELTALLARGLHYAGGTHNVADILMGVERGEFQLWQHDHSVIVTQINLWPQGREVYVFLAAGRMSEIQEMHAALVEWARAQGCTKATFRGRPGWARTFLTSEEGWTSPAMIFEKEL